MNPLELLDRLTADGVTVTADGDLLHLRSATPIPTDLLAEARAAKPELLRLALGIAAMREWFETHAAGLRGFYADPEILADAEAIRPRTNRGIAA